MNKKGLSGGVVSGLVFGIAGLIIAVIIAFVITSTLNNSGLIENDNVYTTNIVNESVTFVATNDAQTLDAASYATGSSTIECGTITYVANETVTGVLLTAGNYTQSDCTLLNATELEDAIGNGTVYVSYPYTTTVSYTKNSAGNISTNFSAGVDNISAKVPTVLLIGAIVLILGVLALLVGIWRKMRMGGNI